MGCAPIRGPHPQLTARQGRLLRRIWGHPGATTAELTGRFSNPAVTRVDLIALIDASLVVPVTEIRTEHHHDTNITLSIRDGDGVHRSTSTLTVTTHHTDRDTARNGPLRWRTTLPGDRLQSRGTLRDITAGARGERIDDWWLCPRGTEIRNEAITRLRCNEEPLGPLDGPDAALEAAAWALTAITDEPDAYAKLRQPWRELSGATPTDAVNTGTTATALAAATAAHIDAHQRALDAAHQRRLAEATGDEATVVATLQRIQGRWKPRQGWCCGTLTYRYMRV